MANEQNEHVKQEDKGFNLPSPKAQEESHEGTSTSQATMQIPNNKIPNVDSSSRDMVIGAGILAILVVAFFFAKNAYSNDLVSKRIQPERANASGWWLFIFLTSLSTAVVLTAVNPDKFMTPYLLGPMGIVALFSLIFMIKNGRN